MILFNYQAPLAAHRSAEPLQCEEKLWKKCDAPYGTLPQRNLVVSNGPVTIDDFALGPKVDHLNLYWGKIPFPGTELRLRLYMAHVISTQSHLDNIDVRFCLGVNGGGAGAVKIVKQVWTTTTPPAKDPRQYLVAGQTVALAQLSQKWQHQLPPKTTIAVPDDSQAGDVTGLAFTLRQSPTEDQCGWLVAEVDLRADSAAPDRSLIVRTVARKPNADLGTCGTEPCAYAGDDSRGWWPEADIDVEGNPDDPILPDGMSTQGPFAAMYKLCAKGAEHLDWAMFNRVDDKGKTATTNALDTFGTNNNCLWGVNILYHVYYRTLGFGGDPLSSSIACLTTGSPAGFAIDGPFGTADSPWDRLAAGKPHKVLAPSFINRRSDADYDMLDLAVPGVADQHRRFVDYLFANAGSSTLPVGWVFRREGSTVNSGLTRTGTVRQKT